MKRVILSFAFLFILSFATQFFSVNAQPQSESPATSSLMMSGIEELGHLKDLEKLEETTGNQDVDPLKTCDSCNFCWACQYCEKGGACDTTCKEPNPPSNCSNCSSCKYCGLCLTLCRFPCGKRPPFCNPDDPSNCWRPS